ncbi:MAG: acylphosphatase [Acidobacteriota bacterium]
MSDSSAREQRTVRWIIEGRVQRVAFRAFTQRTARELGVVGAVKNLPDGTVEALVRGTPEALATLRAQVDRGPRLARVDRVTESPAVLPEDHRTFEIVR